VFLVKLRLVLALVDLRTHAQGFEFQLARDLLLFQLLLVGGNGSVDEHLLLFEIDLFVFDLQLLLLHLYNRVLLLLHGLLLRGLGLILHEHLL
jgi:hypothetical protein